MSLCRLPHSALLSIELIVLCSLLLDLPLEMQSMILRSLDHIHYLTLLLTCRDMGPIVNFAIGVPRTKKDCALGHWVVERGRRDVLTSFICSKCGKFKLKNDFSDNIKISGALDPALRWCIACNARQLDPEIYHFTQDGVSRVMCHECKGIMSLPLYLHTTSRSNCNIRCKSCLTRRYGHVWLQRREVTILEPPILYDHQRISDLSLKIDFGTPVASCRRLPSSS